MSKPTNKPPFLRLRTGERPCATCGKRHVERWVDHMTTWLDPDDGHVYRPESWESLGRKYLALMETTQT